MKPYGFVYETTNKVNGMKYIGKCIYHRKNDWQKYLGSGIYLKEDIEKYGRENFIRIVLEEAYSDKDLNLLEQEYIKRFNAAESPNYYNAKVDSIGGDIFTHNPRKEELRRMRREQMSGKGNHQYGKQKTEKMISSVKEANSRAIEIDGISYKSTADASRLLKINSTTIGYRLDSSSFPNYRRLVPKKTTIQSIK